MITARACQGNYSAAATADRWRHSNERVWVPLLLLEPLCTGGSRMFQQVQPAYHGGYILNKIKH
jgi:hypothetical protein